MGIRKYLWFAVLVVLAYFAALVGLTTFAGYDWKHTAVVVLIGMIASRTIRLIGVAMQRATMRIVQNALDNGPLLLDEGCIDHSEGDGDDYTDSDIAQPGEHAHTITIEPALPSPSAPYLRDSRFA